MFSSEISNFIFSLYMYQINKQDFNNIKYINNQIEIPNDCSLALTHNCNVLLNKLTNINYPRFILELFFSHNFIFHEIVITTVIDNKPIFEDDVVSFYNLMFNEPTPKHTFDHKQSKTFYVKDNTKNNSNYSFIIDIILLDESNKETKFKITLHDEFLSDDINLFIY